MNKAEHHPCHEHHLVIAKQYHPCHYKTINLLICTFVDEYINKSRARYKQYYPAAEANKDEDNHLVFSRHICDHENFTVKCVHALMGGTRPEWQTGCTANESSVAFGKSREGQGSVRTELFILRFEDIKNCLC